MSWRHADDEPLQGTVIHPFEGFTDDVVVSAVDEPGPHLFDERHEPFLGLFLLAQLRQLVQLRKKLILL